MATHNYGSIPIPDKNPRKEKKEKATPLISIHRVKHSTFRVHKNFLRSNRYYFLATLLFASFIWIYFIPPASTLAVFPFLLLLTTIVFVITSHFSNKIQIFSSLFIFLFLNINYFIGFDLINSLVLLSFIIVLSTLFKTKES